MALVETGGYGYGFTMLTMDVVGNVGGGRVEGFGGGGQGERNVRFGVAIGEILCLFVFIISSLLLLPIVWWSDTQISEAAKGRRQVWDRPQQQQEVSEG